MSLDRNGACKMIGMGVTGAGTIPQKAVSVEDLLQGKKITPELIDEASRLIQEGAEPIEDTRGSAAYKEGARRDLSKGVENSLATGGCPKTL